MLNIENGCPDFSPEEQIIGRNQDAFAGLPVAHDWVIRLPDAFGVSIGPFKTQRKAKVAMEIMNGSSGRKFVQKLEKGQQYRLADAKPEEFHSYTHGEDDGKHGSKKKLRTIWPPKLSA